MQRLHAGNHAELAEARNVGGRCVFNVFNPMPHICGAVYLGSVFVPIERGPDRAIADRMGKDLNSVLVQFSDKLLIPFWVPQQISGERWIIRVRRKHCGGVSLNHYVHKKFHGAGSYPIVMVAVTLLNDLLYLLLADFRGIESVREIKT